MSHFRTIIDRFLFPQVYPDEKHGLTGVRPHFYLGLRDFLENSEDGCGIVKGGYSSDPNMPGIDGRTRQ